MPGEGAILNRIKVLTRKNIIKRPTVVTVGLKRATYQR
jgi:hypothetical protein